MKSIEEYNNFLKSKVVAAESWGIDTTEELNETNNDLEQAS